MTALVTSLVVITLAEMGDKTQLVALAFATRFSPWITLAGVFFATLLVHLFSVAIGELLGIALPTHWIELAAGLAFIIFGLWTIRGDSLDEDTTHSSRFGPFLTVAVTFFLAELGDKTMLATVTVASQQQAFVPVWIGSTLGMTIADGVAIVAGVVAGRRLPQRAIKVVAAAMFVGFGLLALYSALVGFGAPLPR